jgi:hypothetical protein
MGKYMPLYQMIDTAIQARHNCSQSGNWVWYHKWETLLKNIENIFPHGSGLDGEIKIDLASSHSQAIYIRSEVHMMDENGMYNGWERFSVKITPAFGGFNMYVIGHTVKNRRLWDNYKDWISDTFNDCLNWSVRNDEDMNVFTKGDDERVLIG